MKTKKSIWLKRAILMLIPVVLGLLVGIITKPFVSYYESVPRTIGVPSFVFPLVWTPLYLLMGYYHARLLEDGGEKTQKGNMLYCFQLLFNLLWSIIFFIQQKPLLALFDLLLIIVLVIMLFLLFVDPKKKWTWLLLPYIAWLLFAGFLNLDIVLQLMAK